MADVKNPPRVVAQRGADRLLDVGPWHDLRIDRLLRHAVVEEARRPIAVGVHRDQPDLPGRRVQRLRQPVRVAGNFLRSWSAGHAAP